MYNDPSGEFFLAPIVAIVTSKLFLVGAAVGATTYILSSAIKGTPITLKGFLASTIKTGIMYYVGGFLNPSPFSSSTGELLLQGAGNVVSSILPSANINIGNFSFSISPSIAIGKGWGFGANVSATFRAGDFSLSAGFGIMHYGAHAGSGESGWEYRKSAMISYDNGKWGLSLGTNKWSGLHEQRTGVIGFRKGDFNMMYENDGGFGIKNLGLGDKGDSYRTAALNLGIGDFSVGFNLFTGYRNLEYEKERGMPDSKGHFPKNERVDFFGRVYPRGFVREEGAKYRLGVLSLGFGRYRIGVNSEHIRHAIQDRVVHGAIKDGGFENQSWDWKPYFQYRNKNQFTSW